MPEAELPVNSDLAAAGDLAPCWSVDMDDEALLFAHGREVSAAGLRALAYESGDRGTSAWLRSWAGALERPTEEAASGVMPAAPTELAALLAAVPGQAGTGALVERFVRTRRRTDELRSHAHNLLWYPLVLLVFSVIVYVVIAGGVADDVQRLLKTFDVPNADKLPPLLELAMSLRRAWPWWVAAVALPAAALAVLRLCRVRLVEDWLVSLTPGYGLFYWYLALAEAARHTRTLVELQTPLPAAVQAVGGAARHSLLARGSGRIAADLATGQSLHAALLAQPAVPRSVALLLQWGEEQKRLSDSLGLVAEWCDRRAEAEMVRLETTLPPLAVLLAAGSAIGLIGSVIGPMVGLIQKLS